jgi:serine/threonine protein kinase/DNA-binding beta-propeller fold protein YncE
VVDDGIPVTAGAVRAGFGPGQRVAGYVLEEQIGAGGMAVVFRAVDERLGRPVALKILAPALAADLVFRKRFIRESRAAAAVDDPHIIPVYEAGEADGILFIAMRLVPGRDARTLLYHEGPLPPGRVAAIVSPVASALDAAHAAGLVHRDVKPANMLVDTRPDRPDHVYLSDFGLSKASLPSVGLTGSGFFLGTPSYTAPEQIQGGVVDGRADQYGLACAAFELLAGGPPFERDQGMAVIWAHLSEAPPSLCSRRADLPGPVDGVFARALAKGSEDRYPSCRDFAEALRAALGLMPYNSGPGIIPVLGRAKTEIARLPARNRAAGAGVPQQRIDAGNQPQDGGQDPPTIASTSARHADPAEALHDAAVSGPVADDGNYVAAVAFSPGGNTVAVGDSSGNTYLCEVATASVIENLTASLAESDPASHGVEAVAYSPDGSLLAAAAVDGTTRMWDLRSHQLRNVLTHPDSAAIETVAFSPDGSVLAAGDDNGNVCLWGVSTGNLTDTLTNPESQGVFSVAFSPDGSMLAAGDGNGSAYVWDARAGQLIAALAKRGAGEIFSVAFTDDGSVLAAGDGDGSIYLWDPGSGDQISVLTRRRSAGVSVLALAFSAHGLELAAGYSSGGICLWDALRRRPITMLGKRDDGPVFAVAYSPDSKALVTGHSDGEALLWDIDSGSWIVIVPSG